MTETVYAVAWSPPNENDGQYRRVRSAEIYIERTALTAAIVLFIGLSVSAVVYVISSRNPNGRK